METPRTRSRRRQTGGDPNVDAETPRRTRRRSARTTTGGVGGIGSAADIAMASPTFINSRQVLNSLSAPQSAAQVTTGLLLNEYSPSLTHSARHGVNTESLVNTPQRSIQRSVAPSHGSAAHHYYEHSPARDTALRRRQQVESRHHNYSSYQGDEVLADVNASGGVAERPNRSRLVWGLVALCVAVVGIRVYSWKRRGAAQQSLSSGHLQRDFTNRVKDSDTQDLLLSEGSSVVKDRIESLIEQRISSSAVELTSQLQNQLNDSLKDLNLSMTQLSQDLTNSKARALDVESDYNESDKKVRELLKRVESVEGDVRRVQDESVHRITAAIQEVRVELDAIKERSPKTTAAADVFQTFRTAPTRLTALSASNPIVHDGTYDFEDLLTVVERLWNDVHLASSGMINWALESVGARVVKQLTVVGIGSDSWSESAFRFLTATTLTPRWSEVTYPRSAAPDVLLTRGPPAPGDSFSFLDLPANITIQLPRAISVTEVALEQVLPELTPHADVAPHAFQLWGWPDAYMSGCTRDRQSEMRETKCTKDTSMPILIAENLEFAYPLYRLQVFPTKIATTKGCILSVEDQEQGITEKCGGKLYFRRLTFEFLTNHGGSWTSVGRVRVHGTPSHLSAPPFVIPKMDDVTVVPDDIVVPIS